MPETLKPWSKELTQGQKLSQRLGSNSTYEQKKQMLSRKHFSHGLWYGSSAYFWLVWQEFRAGASVGLSHRWTLRNMSAWQPTSWQSGTPAAEIGSQWLIHSSRAPGVSHGRAEPLHCRVRIHSDSWAALTPGPSPWKALSQLVSLSMRSGSFCSLV